MYAYSLPYVATIAAIVLALVIWLAAANPVLRRLALRNVIRRPGEAFLVIVGSMLGTAIIVGSFAVGDSLRMSAKEGVYSSLGVIDEQVAVPNPGDVTAVNRELASLAVDSRVDGLMTLSAIRAGVSAGSPESLKAEPEAVILDADFAAARSIWDNLRDVDNVDARL